MKLTLPVRSALVVFVTLAVGGPAEALAQGRQSLLLSGTIKDYVYPAPDFVLKGQEARPLPDGRLQLKGITVETRRPEGEINFLLQTAGCFFDKDSKAKEITSDEALEVRGKDGSFLMTGVGYHFLAGTNQLTIRSNVVTRFDRSLLGQTNSPASDRPATNQFFTITSREHEFNGITGNALWRHEVVATDGDALLMKAGLAEFNIASVTNAVRQFVARDGVELRLLTTNGTATARSAEALVSSRPGMEGRVELRGEPTWDHGNLSGAAGLLTWESVSNRFKLVGTDGVRLRFPATVLSTNSAAVAEPAAEPQWIDLAGGRHEFQPGRLDFAGNVKAVQGTNWNFTTRELVVDLDATNRPTRIVAEGDFHFTVEQHPNRGEGWADRAEVAAAADGRQQVRLTGSPRWVSPELQTSADTLLVTEPLGVQEFDAEGNARLQITAVNLAGFNWFGTVTNPPPARPASTNLAPLIITADRYRFASNVVTFTGHVHGVQGTNSFMADVVTLRLSPERKLREMLATGKVLVRQGAMVLAARELKVEFDENAQLLRAVALDEVRICGQQVGGSGRATGIRLDFNGATGDAILTGQPELIFWARPRPPREGGAGKPREVPPIRHTGDQIIWNLRTEKLGGQGGYRQLSLPADMEISRECD